MFCFQICTRHHLRLILSPQRRRQSLSLGITQVCSAVPRFLLDNIDDSHSCDQYMKFSLANRLSQAWVHFVTDLANLLTDHKMSSHPILAKYKHFKTICERTSDNSPTDSSSSCLNWWSSKQGCDTFWSCTLFLFANHSIPQHIFWACPSMSQDHASVCAWGFSHTSNFCCSRRNTWLEHLCVLFNDCFIRFLFRWVHPKYSWSRNDVDSSISSFRINFFTIRDKFCFLPTILMSSTCTDRNNPCLRWRTWHPKTGTFSHQRSIELRRTASLTTGQLMGDHRDFPSRSTTGSSIFSHVSGPFVPWKTYPYARTFRFGIFEEHPPILPGCSRILHQLLVHHNLVILQ